MTRREWLALGGIALTGACASKKRIGFPGYALVATAGDKSVTVVDLMTFHMVKAISVGGSPTAVVPAAGGRSYVLTPATGSIHIIDANLQLAASRRLADRLSNLHLAADGTRLLATAAPGRELIEVDPSDLHPLRRHKLSAEPIALDMSGSTLAAVSSGKSGIVELFDFHTGQHTQARLPGEIGGLRFRGDGKLVLVANYHDRSLTALDVPSLQVVVDLPLAMKPETLCFNADGGQLFVSGEGMDAVAIAFPYNPIEVEQTVLAGRDPGVMACSQLPPYLFVAAANGSDVCILNIDTRKVIGIVEVGQNPSYIAITPDSRYALVLNERSDDLAVIYIPGIGQNTVRMNRYKTGGALFTMMPVGSKPVHVGIVARSA